MPGCGASWTIRSARRSTGAYRHYAPETDAATLIAGYGTEACRFPGASRRAGTRNQWFWGTCASVRAVKLRSQRDDALGTPQNRSVDHQTVVLEDATLGRHAVEHRPRPGDLLIGRRIGRADDGDLSQVDRHLRVEADGNGVIGLRPQAVEILDVEGTPNPGPTSRRPWPPAGSATARAGRRRGRCRQASGWRCRR